MEDFFTTQTWAENARIATERSRRRRRKAKLRYRVTTVVMGVVAVGLGFALWVVLT